MKILAIRGKNLASLANEFCVDFQSEPLASAGLYAITGVTGSGKSSLLDALCLALYERTPRLARATAQGESIPDVGAHSVGPADPRTLLRRGAADGFAEVDFVGSDARAYRARWSVRRARNKADGRLQQSEVTLLQLADQRVLGDHRKSETLKLIERCIGLSFEQFTRAVLLAQNDFAVLLKASDDERAELLQTLTGTETYTRISMQAFARARAEGEALKLLRLQLESQEPMAAEARVLKDGELTAQNRRVRAVEQQKTAIEGLLRWHQQSERLQANVAEAGAPLAAARAAQAAAADRQARFGRIEAVQPARALCAEVGRLERELAGGTLALDDSRGQLAQASKIVDAAQAALAAATREVQQAEQASADAQPAVDQAKALDAQISALTPTHQAAANARALATRALGEQDAKGRALDDQLRAAQNALHAARRWLVEHQAERPLADGWQRWETLLAHAAARLGESAMAAAQGLALGDEEAAIRTALAAADVDHRARVAAHQAAAAALDAASQAVAAGLPDEIARDQQRVETRRTHLASARMLSAELAQLQQRRQQFQEQRQTLRATLDDCQQQLARCAAAKPLAERDLASAENSLRIAELAVSENVEQLRATLEAGDPCPVCGAPDHPYARHNPSLDGVLQALRAEAQRTRQVASELAHHASTAAAQQQASQNQALQLDPQIASLTSALERSQPLWAAHPLAGELRAIADADRAAWLGAQHDAVTTRLAALASAAANCRAAARRRDDAQHAADQAQAAMSTARDALVRLELDHQKRVQAGQHARQKLVAAQQQRDAALAELDAAFPDALWRAAWGADAQGFVARCRAQVQAWTARQQQVDALSATITTLGASVQGARDALASAARHRQTQAEQCALLEADLLARQAQRDAVFAGQPVSAVVAAFGARLDQARGEFAQRQRGSQQAEAERGRLDGSIRQRVDQLAHDRSCLATANQALADWLRDFNAPCGERDALAPEALAALLALAPDWIQGERQALQAFADAVANALAVFQERQQAHADHLAGRPGAAVAASAGSAEVSEVGEVAGLREALATALAELEPANTALSQLQLELARDDERRQQTQSLVADLDRQSASARVWSQLSELIGSADGKKFRNFAQQMTLDILLGYANRHLETLSRRYRLERIRDSLGLLVVDSDMGDEVRSVHSLSGGESFLVSLALALGLASLSSHRVRVESLFIDEGFGSLDADALNVAMEALDSLQAQGRKVGVISHVQEMTERIGTRIVVERLAGGQSRVRVVG